MAVTQPEMAERQWRISGLLGPTRCPMPRRDAASGQELPENYQILSQVKHNKQFCGTVTIFYGSGSGSGSGSDF